MDVCMYVRMFVRVYLYLLCTHLALNLISALSPPAVKLVCDSA